MQVFEGRRGGVEHCHVLTVNGPTATLKQARNVTLTIMNSVRPLEKK